MARLKLNHLKSAPESRVTKRKKSNASKTSTELDIPDGISEVNDTEQEETNSGSSNTTLSENGLLDEITAGSKKVETFLTYLEEGQYFGAYNLLNENTTRPVSVYAAKLVEVIEVDINAFRGMIRFHDNRILQERLDFLKSIPLLSNFSRVSLLQLLRKANLLEFERYQHAFTEG